MAIEPLRKPHIRPAAPPEPPRPANRPDPAPPRNDATPAQTGGANSAGAADEPANGSNPSANISAERKAQIDSFVEENATHEKSFLGIRVDSDGGTRIGKALTGDSSLGDLTPAERTYLAQQGAAAWNGQTDDGGSRRENISQAADEVRDDPAASRALALALSAPALSDDDGIRRAGAIMGPVGMTERHGEMFDAAVDLDLAAVMQSYEGNEVGLAQRLGNADEETRQEAWSILADQGRLPQGTQQALAAALFFTDKNAAGASSEYRQGMAEAIALARRPGTSPQDRLGRDSIASNLAAVMETDGGREMLLGEDVTAGARLWALNEIANQQACINPEMYAGLDAPGLADAPGNPGGAANGDQPSEAEVYADLSQMALDVSGIVDPTPISDGANTLVSLFRGDVGGALMSAAGMVPYIGDLAKAGKLGKWARTVDNAIDLAQRSPQFMTRVRPMLEALQSGLKAIPESVMSKLPQSAQDTIRGIIRKLDDVAQAVARRAPLVVDDAIGTTKTLPDGRVARVGDPPLVNQRADGNLDVTRADGTTAKLREPQTYDQRVDNPDGSVTYTRNGQDVTYGADGFPQFESKADIYLDAGKINSANKADHFRSSNEIVQQQLKQNPGLKDEMGLTDAQYNFIMREPPSSKSPPGLTWHHHQDTGKMQLVNRSEHNALPGGHTGGMSIWGGGYD
ncbi:HNH endonuclease [Paracoccus sediminicola]|uniref:HNH endonuclease n=1 Tax=Paracoccus sediminicola TaxID=3017783 RepID=UPI0022F05E3A|nr:HNH endonuclease [Paracoccus sediminicola]WBU57677.1 HNH endonuclease [Paracoccus sediminicola]